jgi:hypothetical protein
MRFCEIMRTRSIARSTTIAAFAFFGCVTPATAASIYIDFGTYNGAPSSLFGAAAGDPGVWNNVLRGVPSDLLDTDGNASGVRVSVIATSDGTGAGSTGDAALLMNDNFYSSAGAWSVSFSGLDDGIYDLYLYDPANRAVSTGSGTANGVGFASINGAFSGSFTLNADYLLLSGIVVKGGLLTAGATEPGAMSGLAGLQLVATELAPTTVPEPNLAVLLACGLVMLAGLKLRAPTAGA